MASIANDPGGRRRILFLDRNSDRKTIWLGKVSKRLAEEIKTKVESINCAAIAGVSIDGETAEWLGKIGNSLHTKLAAAGLVAPRQVQAPPMRARMGEFLQNYMLSRTDIKPSTRCNLEVCKGRLVEFFGKDKALDEITVADAKSWEIWLKGRYAKATVGRTIRRAKQFFQAGIDSEVIGKNPFAKIKAPGQTNEARKFFVTQETAFKVLDACPDVEWRLLFALARFGGLRCPSEHLAVTWADVDWERSRFRVVSAKKEHLDGGGVRWVPIFPELRPYLDEAFELAPEGAVHVISRYRDTRVNLRTQFLRIIRKAGLNPWPKLFQNLRSSRETELAKDFPIHVVCAWIGNTAAIAQKHYLQVTDRDFDRAAKMDSANYSAQTAQNTAQHPTAPTAHGGSKNAKNPEPSGVFCENPAFSEVNKAPRVGLEHPLQDQLIPLIPLIALQKALQKPPRLITIWPAPSKLAQS